MITAERYHDISCGHRVYGHENKCATLHGHNYRITFFCTGELDGVGRVLDFSVIKQLLCQWLEDNYDHKFLVWEKDPLSKVRDTSFQESFVVVPYNPTAENMAQYLVEIIGPMQLKNTGVVLRKCTVEETRKCSATFEV